MQYVKQVINESSKIVFKVYEEDGKFRLESSEFPLYNNKKYNTLLEAESVVNNLEVLNG